LLAKVKELEKDPSYVADQSVAKRLFGNFPYGRPQLGSSESLAKIDFADLLLAEQKFLTADNATLAVIGNVKPDYALRATKRLFGGWLKSDKKIPATFTQPDPPSAEKQIVELPNLEKQYLRTASNAPARNDKDFYAFKIFKNVSSQLIFAEQQISYQPHLLRGAFVISIDLQKTSEPSINGCTQGGSYLIIKEGKTIFPPIPQNLFDTAKNKVISDLTNEISDSWLDLETFKLSSIKDEIQKANNVTLSDVQKVAEIYLNAPAACIIVKSTETKQ
jgi:predicted Zn-dependent peptidase